MTAQELFDRVSLHLLAQNSRSVDVTGRCRYRGCGGRMCAIGVLIPDQLYGSWMDFNEGMSAPLIRVLETVGLGHHLDICEELQLLHDAAEPCLWPNKLSKLAYKFGLEPYEHK
jgi:hypothetical protein